MNLYKALCSVGVFIFAVLFIQSSPTANAQTSYGSGNYGNCTYTDGCEPAVIEPVTTPSGLEVVINLENGMVIPKDGFTIAITKLGDSTVTIQKVEIKINGKLAQTLTPDASQSTSWYWNPEDYPGDTVTIIITASDGSTSTHTYSVKVSDKSRDDETPIVSQPTTNKPDDTDESAQQVPAVLSAAIPESVKQVFRSIPESVINSFPYFLFILLGFVVVFVILQVRRELIAARKAKNAIEQEKLIIELKRNFLGLASHYLRTPLTILSGGVELMEGTKAASTEVLAPMKNVIDGLSDHVKKIIASGDTMTTSPTIEKAKGTGVRIGVNIAIILIAVIVAVFNLLAYGSGRGAALFNVVTQVVALVLMSILLYQAERRFTLRKKEREAQDKLLLLQQQLQNSQDTFLEQTATLLYDDYTKLKTLAEKLPETDTTKAVHAGLQKLSGVVTKCRTAQLIKGSSSSSKPSVTTIADLFNYKQEDLSQQITDKQITLATPKNHQLVVKEPSLLQTVAQSLVDNAVAYSSEKGNVVLGANDDGKQLNLFVSDQGRGIPKDRQQLLFQPLSKIEGYESFDHEGMGLSLYLDKLIMEYLGGSINLQSEEDKGTTVNLSLPSLSAKAA